MLVQRSFEDLGTALSEVTFCVLDLETTGGSPATCAITEVGALKVCRGEVIGTLQTLVDPGQPVPAFIRLLTGLSEEQLEGAPSIEQVLPSLLEFVGDSVIVAHNARFDIGFINAALRRGDYPLLSNRVIDTAQLARKVLSGEVRDRRLATLARHLRCAHEPCHRAFADVLATTDVLHALIERVSGFGVVTLEDLLAVSSARLDGTFTKIRFADSLPRAMGVYRFIGAGGATLYVGKASDLRRRVRSYFYGDPRHRVRNLLRETQDVVVEEHATLLEAEVAEARAIAAEMPPYNRAGKRIGTWHVRVGVRDKVPRVSTARSPRDDGALYLGPLSSMKAARRLIDALRDATRLHRCTDPRRCRECPFATIGSCSGPDRRKLVAEIRTIVAGALQDPDRLARPIATRMARLAHEERYEEAAEVRDRGALLERTLSRALQAGALIRAGDVVVALGERALLIRAGILVAAVNGITSCAERLRLTAIEPQSVNPKEPWLIASWLDKHAAEATLLHAEDPWVLPAAARPGNRFVGTV